MKRGMGQALDFARGQAGRTRPAHSAFSLRRSITWLLTIAFVLQSLIPSPLVYASGKKAGKRASRRLQTVATQTTESITVYGPRRFDRKLGKPVDVVEQFTIPSDATAPFAVLVQNGAGDGSSRVSSATISLNGSDLFTSRDFGQNVGSFTKAVRLVANNTLKVSLASAPGSFLTIRFTARRIVRAAKPVILDFNPRRGPIGTNVVITGTALKADGSDPVVTFAGNDHRLPAQIRSVTATAVTVIVPNGAVTGTIELRTPGGAASTATPFIVDIEQDFQLLAIPASAVAVERTSAVYTVSLTSAQTTFTQLAKLSVEGLPASLSSDAVTFDPPQITAGGRSTLTINLSQSSLGSGSYDFTIRGVVQVEGGEQRRVRATLRVLPGGQTTLAGRVLSNEKEPILGATVSLDGRTAMTDGAGSFLLSGVTAGVNRPLMVDGRTASAPNRTYPVIVEPATIIAGQANVVPYTFYLPAIDTQHEVEVIPGQATVATNPRVLGLQMTIPAGANLRNRDNAPVTRVSITPLPIDRTPAPLPPNVGTSMVFTSQPGGAIADIPMPVVYPNLAGADPGTQIELYAFNHDTVQWYIYGYGRVSRDGRTISPETNPQTGRPYGLPDFSWHFPNVTPPGRPKGPFAPPAAPSPPCDGTTGSTGSHPLDLASGLKIERSTDISFGGERGSLSLTRTFTSDLAGSCDSCPFGRGTTHNYAMRLVGTFEAGGAGRVVMPGEIAGQLFSFAGTDPDGALVFSTLGTIDQLGDVVRKLTNGSFEYRTRDRSLMRLDSNGRLTALVDPNGNTTTLNYSGANLTSITDPVGRSITLSYGSNNNVSRATDPVGRIWQYSYDGGNHLASVTDPDGKVTTYGYDFLSRLNSIADPQGNSVKQITYDGSGRVSQQVFADGGIEKYSYTLSGSIVTSTTITDPLGRTVTKQFNADGYVIAETDALRQTVKVDRDISTNLPTATSGPCGCSEATRQFDDRGNLTSITDRLGQTVRYEYDPTFNKVKKLTDQLGRVTTYTYDANGNMLSATNALSQTTSLTYDGFGELLSVTDPLAHTSHFEYDASGNMTGGIDALGHRTTFEYDGIGRRTATIDPLSRRVSLAYDTLGRINSITDAAGKATTLVYDPNGNVVSVTNALNQKTTFTYDSKNRLVTTTDPLGRVDRRDYDADDELTTIRSPSGRTTRYAYDKRGQVTTITDALGSTLNFIFDIKGKLSSLTDQRGNKTTFVYDELSRLTRRIDPLGLPSDISYDAASNVVQRLDRLGRQTSLSYDALNRPSRIAYADALVTYNYDSAGRLTHIDDSQSSSIDRSYDDANRLLSETSPAGVVRYTYNAASQRASMTVADRSPVNYGYDAAGRLQAITQGTEAFTYGYDSLSRVSSLQRPNGIKTTYTFDAAGELARLIHTNLSNQAVEDFVYSRNPDGEIQSITSLFSTLQPATAKIAAPADAANRIAQFGPQSFVYDAEGQMTARTAAQGTTTFDWDARGRLTRATLPGGQQVNYQYDTFGRRSATSAGGLTTSFLYDNEDVVLDRGSDASTVDYLNGPGIDNKLRQSSAATGSLYFIQDQLGSTAALTNSAGGLVERMQYESFGESAGSSLTRFGYTGRERDSLTKLLYYRARWYDPVGGRFISEDPDGFGAGDFNLYRYVANNPFSSIDPTGTSSQELAIDVAVEILLRSVGITADRILPISVLIGLLEASELSEPAQDFTQDSPALLMLRTKNKQCLIEQRQTVQALPAIVNKASTNRAQNGVDDTRQPLPPTTKEPIDSDIKRLLKKPLPKKSTFRVETPTAMTGNRG